MTSLSLLAGRTVAHVKSFWFAELSTDIISTPRVKSQFVFLLYVLQHFTGGISNVLYGYFEDGKFEEDVVLFRIDGHGTELMINRKREQEYMKGSTKMSVCTDPEKGNRVFRPPPPRNNHKALGFHSNTGQNRLKYHKATKQDFNVGPSLARQRNAIHYKKCCNSYTAV